MFFITVSVKHCPVAFNIQEVSQTRQVAAKTKAKFNFVQGFLDL